MLPFNSAQCGQALRIKNVTAYSVGRIYLVASVGLVICLSDILITAVMMSELSGTNGNYDKIKKTTFYYTRIDAKVLKLFFVKEENDG